MKIISLVNFEEQLCSPLFVTSLFLRSLHCFIRLTFCCVNARFSAAAVSYSRFPMFLTSLLCSRLRLFHILFVTSLFYLLRASIVSFSVCYVIALFSASAVSSSICCVTILYIFKSPLFHYPVCCVTALFSASIAPSSVCYVTILFLQGFHCFITCLLRHCPVLGFDCFIFCLLCHYPISSRFPVLHLVL